MSLDGGSRDPVTLLILAALAGGYLRAVRILYEWPHAAYWVRAMAEVGIAIGAAAVVVLASFEAGLSNRPYAVVLAAAIAGYSGKRALDIIAARWLQKQEGNK